MIALMRWLLPERFRAWRLPGSIRSRRSDPPDLLPTSPRRSASVARLAVDHADETPVFVGVGGLRTSQVLAHIDGAAAAGAAGVLLAPMTYQALTDTDVFELFRSVSEHTELPVIVYDNPGTTHFAFSTQLYARIAELPGIASIKIPAVPAELSAARDHVARIREMIPRHVTIGVSGDASAAMGLAAGCDAWYSVIAGTLPAPALAITRAAQRGDMAAAFAASEQLAPLWQLFAECSGSLRVVAAIAEQLGYAPKQCLPLPIQGLTDAQRAMVVTVVRELGLGEGD